MNEGKLEIIATRYVTRFSAWRALIATWFAPAIEEVSTKGTALLR